MAKGLGKGLNAFFNEVESTKDEIVRDISILELRPNPYQPRKIFDDEAIEELKNSIIEHGILQPIIARKSIKGYEIVVGERRYRAALLAKLDYVPVVVRELSEQQMMELSILENLQREDLNPMEEAQAYQTLMEKLNITQEQLSIRLGKSRPHIANHIRLLTLPKSVQELVSTGKLSMGHGRTLLSLQNKAKIETVALKVVNDSLNVRQLERLIQELNNVPRETIKENKKKDIFIRHSETSLQEFFGTNVQIKQNKNKGKIEIEFFTKEDLNRILELLNQNKN